MARHYLVFKIWLILSRMYLPPKARDMVFNIGTYSTYLSMYILTYSLPLKVWWIFLLAVKLLLRFVIIIKDL